MQPSDMFVISLHLNKIYEIKTSLISKVKVEPLKNKIIPQFKNSIPTATDTTFLTNYHAP